MTDLIIILILAAIVASAGCYVYKAKKSGKKCIGCPDSASCGSGASACSGQCTGCSCGCGGAKSE